jgi:hypothetical protein
MNRSEIANSRRWGRIYSRARRLTRYQLFSETTEGFVLKILFPFPLLAAAPYHSARPMKLRYSRQEAAGARA